ncbi:MULTISPECIES: RNA polymerase sigma factor [unclassified Shewanella]|uniref:RNA polymerase sigma factor n=1 Tax=unclassified Shewanella TaxID=196818 RepID=UPI003FA3BF1A
MSAQVGFIKPCEIPESELIEQAKQGDRNAFKQLYLNHHKRVYGICYRLCGQTFLAEEATQDTFVRLWQKLPLFRGDSQFSIWLHSMTVNQALSSIKKHKRFWTRFISLTDHTEIDETEMEYAELDKLLLRLPERARIVFVLFAIEGYQHNEIALQLNIAQGTSKAQYHRARKLLQEMMS